ncbi:MAG: ABC transporter ATP-binding protein [Nanobdellota archaeon]
MNKKIHYKYNLKIYWNFLKKYKLLFFGLLSLILFIEASYVADNYIFKLIVKYSEELIKEIINKGDFIFYLEILAIVFVVLMVFRSLAKFFQFHLMAHLGGGLRKDLKEFFFNHLVRLSFRFHSDEKKGALISKIIRNANAIDEMTDIIIFNFMPLFFKLSVVLITLLFISKIHAVIILSMIIVYLIYSIIFTQKRMPYIVESNEAEDFEKAKLADYMNNVESIKYFGKENRINKKFGKHTSNSQNKFIDRVKMYSYIEAGQSTIIALGLLSIFFFSVKGILNGTMDISTVTYSYTVFGGLLGNLFSFMHGYRRFFDTMAHFEGLFRYAKLENEIKNPNKAKKARIRKGEVEFRNVNFGYNNKRKIFKNLNLKIDKGKKVALVGHSGSGKSTLIKLLYRLYDVNKGNILIDGKDIKYFNKEDLRSEMSIVPQECALFDDTIFNNIAFAKPGATKKEVYSAAKKSQLDKIVKDFPQGYDTIVGERGIKLSGGEKQRVSIARALLADKKLLILDEATSSLDSKTEFDIQKALEKLMKNRTSIIIAHRLSTIMKADFIVVFSKGKIVEKATHDELVAKEGHYSKMWDLQKGGFD